MGRLEQKAGIVKGFRKKMHKSFTKDELYDKLSDKTGA